MLFRRALNTIASPGLNVVTKMPFLWRAPSLSVAIASSAFAPPSLMSASVSALPASSPALSLYFNTFITTNPSTLSSSSVVDAGVGASSILLSAEEMSLRGPNSREPRKSNHGARPCSSIRRRRKYRTRVNEHPHIPLSKQKQKKGMDF